MTGRDKYMLHSSTEVTYSHRYIIEAFKSLLHLYLPATIVMTLMTIITMFQPRLSTVIVFMFSWILYTVLMVYTIINLSIALYTRDRFMQMLEK